MKKILNILLVFALTGLPNLFAQSLADANCCHASVEAELSESACCEMSDPIEETQTQGCSTFEINSTSIDNCGCIHQLFTIDDTVINQLKNDFTKINLTSTNSSEVAVELGSNAKYFVSNIPYNIKIPIYISVSSFLI